jgi:methylmalonyl-CoA/ethylmalonyl-CoA epimerase
MTGIDELKARLKLPAVSQIGVVVRDVRKTAEHYSTLFGIGPFTIYEFAAEKHWHMEELTYSKVLMGKAVWGNLELELIQPLEGKSIHVDFLRQHGEGLQHLGFNIADFDEYFKRFTEAGFKPLLRGETYVETYKGNLKACYFDTRAIGGIIFEIIWKSWLPECQKK